MFKRNAERRACATRAIVFGRGMTWENTEIEGAPVSVLSAASETRARAMAQYYHDNKELFTRAGSLIVCSGGYAGLAQDQERPPKGVSEADGLVNLLRAEGVPSKLLEKETRSPSTFDNYVECLKAGYFSPDQPFTPEDPLMGVASGSHGKQRVEPIGRAAYGITHPDAFVHLRAEKETFPTRAHEYVGGIATRLALEETNVTRYDAESLAAASRRFVEFTEDPSSLLVPVLRHPSLLLAA